MRKWDVDIHQMPEPRDPTWQGAKCEGLGGVAAKRIFFPTQGESSDEAKSLCMRCPQQANCLEYALRANIKFGVWGGTTAKEREGIKRRNRMREK